MTLYNNEILRLASDTAEFARLPDPQASAERRSPICGSRIIVDVRLDDDGRIAALGLDVRACALGQASASLMAQHATGRSLDELLSAYAHLSGFLTEARADSGDWPGLEIFAPAIPYRARHAAILLPFEAVAEAARAAAS
jgi:NifU-like protein involved in Fe-S cluster formation